MVLVQRNLKVEVSALLAQFDSIVARRTQRVQLERLLAEAQNSLVRVAARTGESVEWKPRGPPRKKESEEVYCSGWTKVLASWLLAGLSIRGSMPEEHPALQPTRQQDLKLVLGQLPSALVSLDSAQQQARHLALRVR